MVRSEYRTLDRRKSAEAERRNRAADFIAARLTDFAREKGGRYILFGSLARRDARFDSDVDMLLDFPPESEAEAWRLAESVCAELDMVSDIKPLGWCTPDFAARIMAGARVIA